ncbi:TetR/AcrR family transcriptional regulator [Streptomyces sp. MMG1121]|uniref:TetR/AcrR family transcriptional regulator n=1 Tax=Streptomyces sp. MMG1121 TaxID=1415544 RepID=UPI001F2FF110|nr:TetR/AcrR family transcriptional regulator [Streptomyces sp. MMG1121]
MAQALGTSDRMLLYYFGTKERLIADALALDENRPLLRTPDLLDTLGRPQDPAGLRRIVEELWRLFSASDRRALLPLSLEVMAASLLHPDRYGPLMHDVVTGWTRLLTSMFSDLGLAEERARTEATLLVDAVFGLIIAPLADGDWDRADSAFHALLDRLEPGWHTT